MPARYSAISRLAAEELPSLSGGTAADLDLVDRGQSLVVADRLIVVVVGWNDDHVHVEGPQPDHVEVGLRVSPGTWG